MNKKIILISSISIAAIAAAGLILFLVLLNTTSEEEIILSGDKYIAAKSGLNLRSGPDKSSKVVTLIPFGSKVTIEKSEGDEILLDERYGKWVNVKYGNKTGWLFSGFLCDFEPNTIIKPVADYYDKYNDKEVCNSGNNESNCYEVSKVSIKNILDNYVVLQIPFTNYDGDNYLGVVYKYDAKQKKFFEVFNEGGHSIIYILYLDNDKYPDLVFRHGWDGMAGIDIFLGSRKGFKNIFDWWDNCDGSPHELKIGSCGDMGFACRKINKKTDDKIIQYFRFNCDKRKVEKYKETIIIKSSGYISSIDWKNLTIIIKDYEDSENAILKIPKHYNSYHKDSLAGLYIEYLKKLEKNNVVTFSYEIIDGKKIVAEIDRWVL